MIVAVYGSWYSERRGFVCTGSPDQFAAAGREIGKLLAQLKKRLVITSFTPDTLDGYVAEGYVNWLDATEALADPALLPPIQIVQYDDRQVDGLDEPSDRHFATLFAGHGSSITFATARGRLRFSRHLTGLGIADIVIAVGGADHTFMAGEVALLAGKPLIAVGGFGGASRDLLDGAIRACPDPLRCAHLGKLFGPWGKEVRDTVAALIAQIDVVIIHGREEGWRAVRDIVDAAATPEGRFRSVVMRDVFRGSEALPVKWEAVAAGADAAIAVLTPDDFGGLSAESEYSHQRARQNVWLEVGWVWGRLGRTRLILLVRGDIEVPSDFAGIETYRYTTDPAERLSEIQQFLTSLI